MLSNQPARTITASPRRIDWDASAIARIPDGQAIFSVMTGTYGETPPLTDAVLAGLGPLPACRQLPRITSSTWSPERPARLRDSLTTMAPRSKEGISFKLPPNFPIGVLQAEITTISLSFCSTIFLFCSVCLYQPMKLISDVLSSINFDYLAGYVPGQVCA